MEAIYMLAFKINLLLSDDEFQRVYVNVASEANFQRKLMEEFLDRDLL